MGVLTAAKARKMAAVPDAAEKLHLPSVDADVWVRPLTGLLITRIGYVASQNVDDQGAWVVFFPDILHDCIYEDKACKRRVYPTMADAEAACSSVSGMEAVIAMCVKAMELSNTGADAVDEIAGN